MEKQENEDYRYVFMKQLNSNIHQLNLQIWEVAIKNQEKIKKLNKELTELLDFMGIMAKY